MSLRNWWPAEGQAEGVKAVLPVHRSHFLDLVEVCHDRVQDLIPSTARVGDLRLRHAGNCYEVGQNDLFNLSVYSDIVPRAQIYGAAIEADGPGVCTTSNPVPSFKNLDRVTGLY